MPAALMQPSYEITGLDNLPNIVIMVTPHRSMHVDILTGAECPPKQLPQEQGLMDGLSQPGNPRAKVCEHVIAVNQLEYTQRNIERRARASILSQNGYGATGKHKPGTVMVGEGGGGGGQKRRKAEQEEKEEGVFFSRKRLRFERRSCVRVRCNRPSGAA